MGGKARSLRMLYDAGFPVPPFRLLAPRHFALFEENGAPAPQTRAAIDEISAQLSCRRYAVRSSASLEDGADDSFAGIFATRLMVTPEALFDAVVHLYKNVRSEELMTYCRMRRIDPDGLRFSVVIQQMIEPSVSGVCFTANPDGSLHELVLVAAEGTGENVVAERGESCTSYIDRGAPEQAANELLAPHQVREIVSTALELEEIQKWYQDFEWCLDGGGALYVLQSRPITTIARHPLEIYDSANISESYHGITLPLTFSLTQKGYADNFRHLVRLLGRDPHGLESALGALAVHVEGRLYYKLSSWHRLLDELPILGGHAQRSLHHMIGSAAPTADAGSITAGELVTGAGFVARGFSLLLSHPARFRRYRRHMQRLLERHRGRTERCRRELIEEIGALSEDYSELACVPLLNDFFLMLFSYLLRQLLELKGSGQAAFVEMLSTDETSAGSAPLSSLRAIQDHLARHPASKEALERDIPVDRVPDTTLRDLLQRYLETHGWRHPDELKLEAADLREAPALLYRAILAPPRPRRKTAPKPAGALEPLLWLVQRLIQMREEGRVNRSRVIAALRKIVLEVGARLQEEGLIAHPRDVFFLTLDELAAHEPLFNRVTKRKEDFARYETRSPLERFAVRGPLEDDRIPQQHRQNGASPFEGHPSSPGRVTAKAVIITDPAEAKDVFGRIIVAPATDPGWILLISQAAGLVVEKGNLLSHAAIITRELGIPSIVGARGLSSHISDGALITIDGASGKIRVEDGQG